MWKISPILARERNLHSQDIFANPALSCNFASEQAHCLYTSHTFAELPTLQDRLEHEIGLFDVISGYSVLVYITSPSSEERHLAWVQSFVTNDPSDL